MKLRSMAAQISLIAVLATTSACSQLVANAGIGSIAELKSQRSRDEVRAEFGTPVSSTESMGPLGPGLAIIHAALGFGGGEEVTRIHFIERLDRIGAPLAGRATKLREPLGSHTRVACASPGKA